MREPTQPASGESPCVIPADVEQPDRVFAGLSARQLGILASAAALLILGWHLSRSWLPAQVYLALAVPVAVTALALALGRHPDGTGLDVHLLAAAAHWLHPRHLAPYPDATHPDPTDNARSVEDWAFQGGADRAGAAVPDWLAQRATSTTGAPQGSPAGPARTRPLRLPVHEISTATNDHTQIGVLDLGSQGLAVLAALTPVPFTWAASGQQQIVLAAFTRLLRTVELPMQILLRATPLSLRPALDELAHAATGLPHPALAAAATDHHHYLTELDTRADLLTRQVILLLRDPHPTRHRFGDAAGVSQRLLRGLTDVHAALAPAGITVLPLASIHAETVLAASTQPHYPWTPHDIPPLETPAWSMDSRGRAGGDHRG